MRLSALIITKNEESNIGACLESVSWTDEIVVVDAFSDDATVEICKRYTDKVYLRQWDDYSSQKNFGHSKCRHDWILSIDGDERVSPALAEEIKQTIASKEYSAYRIRIRDYVCGKWIEHGGWPLQRHIRLYQKDRARWERKIHEKVVVDGAVGMLSNPLLHFSHPSIARFIGKMNTYTDVRAREWYEQGVRKSWARVILSSMRVFWRRYIRFQGFRDGSHGFVLAVLMAMYQFLERAKLWELWYKDAHGIPDD